MTVDVVCAGPPFLDLVFRGLSRIPEPGEEVLANDIVIVPGAMANVAYALRQLDVEAIVCSPIGNDPAGRLLQGLMAEAGIPWQGRPAAATPISVGLPIDGERSFVTVFPETEVDVETIRLAAPRAVVTNLPLPPDMPTEPRLIGVIGDPQVAVLLDRPTDSWTSLRAVIMNEREAVNLTGRSDASAAARDLATRGCLVIVTRAERGAVAARPDGTVSEAHGVPVQALDTVGAGDLFTAAWIWADLADRPVDESLAIATAYASHSLAAAGARQKGLTRAEFLDASGVSANPGSWMLEARG